MWQWLNPDSDHSFPLSHTNHHTTTKVVPYWGKRNVNVESRLGECFPSSVHHSSLVKLVSPLWECTIQFSICIEGWKA